MEENLREGERRFCELAELLPVIVFETSLQGNLTFVNDIVTSILGYSRDEMLDRPFFNFVAPEDIERCTATARNVMAGKFLGDNEFVLLRKNGTRISTFIQSAPNKNSRGELSGLRGVVLDISKQKRVEAGLRESEEKYRTLINNLKLGIMRTTVGANGRFLEFNKALEEISGYSRDELLAMKVITLYANPLNRKKLFNDAIQTKQTIQREGRLRRKDGSETTISLTLTPVMDERGNILYMDGILEDITERKKMEQRIIDLYENEKKERQELQEEARARGLFTDVLAHELRTPLTPILASTGMLKNYTADQGEIIRQKLIDNIYRSTQILVRRLEELLDLARYSRGTFSLNRQPEDFSLLVKSVVARFRPSLAQKKQTLVEEIPEQFPEVTIDASRLEQVVINLLSNASKFGRDQGVIYCRVFMAGQAIQVDIKDDGIGIPLDSQKRLFQPYHRVEQDRQILPGLGLGLSVARQIVEAHGGKIWLKSQPGEGSTFSFSIPLKQPQGQAAESVPVSKQQKGQ
jgi:PAS domain S-box-containing protein